MGEWKETEVGKVPVAWQVLPIGEFANVTKLAGFEYTKYFEYVDDGEIIALRALNVRDGILDLTDVKRIYKSVSDNLIRSKLFIGDILFTYVGANIGQFALVDKNDKYHLAPNICRIRVGKKCLLFFLFSYFRTEYFRENLENYSVGSSQPTLPMGNIRQILIPLPTLPEQKAIASVLSSLDDKINLLHRQNKTLEAMAETLFRQWFVEEAEEGWEEKPLFSIAEHKKYNVKPNQNLATIYRHYSIPAFDGGKQPIKELGSEIKSNKYKVVANSILISKLNPRFPRVWAITDLMDENSICSTEFQVVYPTSRIYYGFAYYLLKSKQVTEELIGAAGGTSGSHQRVKPEDIFNLSFQMPPDERIEEFNLITSDHLKKVSTNIKQISALEKLRDTLLPKLMSGEVRVEI